MIKNILLRLSSYIIVLLFSTQLCAGDAVPGCTYLQSFFKPSCVKQRLHQIWTQGHNELYLTGYAWHNRFTYSREKINSYNEQAWGGGLGKGFFDERGNWHGLYAFGFLDSHSNVEPVLGYAFQKVITLHHELKAGIGYALLITQRKDLNSGIPFPGALPWASVFYKKVTIAATYIPGFNKNGNVLFLLAKYTF